MENKKDVKATDDSYSNLNDENQIIEGERFICFNVGKEEYAIPLLYMKEVINRPETTRIPKSPAYFEGLMNLRGQVFSLLDLRKKMGATPMEDNEEESVVILDLSGCVLGVLVDRVNQVLMVTDDMIQETIERKKGKLSDYITGCIQRDKDNLLFILDINKLLNVSAMLARKNAA